MTQVPECADVIAHGARALSGGGRWAVLDLKVPGNTPGWLAQLGTATVRPFASKMSGSCAVRGRRFA